jgi:hypothetical protein
MEGSGTGLRSHHLMIILALIIQEGEGKTSDGNVVKNPKPRQFPEYAILDKD